MPFNKFIPQNQYLVKIYHLTVLYFCLFFLCLHADPCIFDTDYRYWCFHLVGRTRYNASHCETSPKLYSQINALLTHFINYKIYCLSCFFLLLLHTSMFNLEATFFNWEITTESYYSYIKLALLLF